MFFSVYVVSVFALSSAFAQKEENDQYLSPLPDTLHFYSPQITFVAALDSLQTQIIDTLQNPTTYLLNTRTAGTGYQCLLAVKTKKGFALFNPFENSSAYASADEITLERVDFDGKGNLELLLSWHFYTGHSGWQNSVHESDGGMQLWNLDKFIRCADLKTYYRFEHWWSSYEEDSTGTKDFDELEILDSGSEYACERIDFQVAKKKLFISEPSVCEEEGIVEELSPRGSEFILEKKYLLRKK